MGTLLDEWKRAVTAQAGANGAIDLGRHAQDLDGLIAAYTPPGLSVDRITGEAVVHQGSLMVDVQLWISPPDDSYGAEHHWINRRIVERTRQAQHRNLRLPSEAQGMGLARALWRQALRLYEELGVVDEVGLGAKDIGRYSNLAAGVDFLNSDERTKVVSWVTGAANALGERIEAGSIRHAWDIADLPQTTSRQALKDAGLAISAEAQFANGNQISLGKATMLCVGAPTWNGRADLKPGSASLARLNLYCDTDQRS